MISKVKAIILRAPGTNCDSETAFAFEEAGAEVSLVDVGSLIRREKKLADFPILVIPGGFTYGDDIAAGRVLANELKFKLGEDVPDFVENGGLILGICNGFQVLAKAGFLPGLATGGLAPLTLWTNDSGRFECRWVNLVANKECPCVFTRGIEQMYLPVAHGEGKVATIPEALPNLKPVLYYANESGNPTAGYPDNPAGSFQGIAGVCDDSGRVFGLMPHPERHIRSTQNPQWTRRGNSLVPGDGFKVFQNAVQFARSL